MKEVCAEPFRFVVILMPSNLVDSMTPRNPSNFGRVTSGGEIKIAGSIENHCFCFSLDDFHEIVDSEGVEVIKSSLELIGVKRENMAGPFAKVQWLGSLFMILNQ